MALNGIVHLSMLWMAVTASGTMVLQYLSVVYSLAAGGSRITLSYNSHDWFAISHTGIGWPDSSLGLEC